MRQRTEARPESDNRQHSGAVLAEHADHHEGDYHRLAWALRVVLAAIFVIQLVRGNIGGALVGGEGVVATFLPMLVSRWSGYHVPWLLEITFVSAMVLQFGSEALKLFELFTYWDKLVHPLEIFLSAGIGTFLLLGYRHHHQLKIPDGLAVAGAMFFGMALGSFWELVEFGMDWFGSAGLQKSNADTMTDILVNDAGAVFGALLAFWLYRHWAPDHVRREFGEIAEWATSWLARLLSRHGRAVGVVFAVVVAVIIVAGWYIDRGPVPPVAGRPVGWSDGTPRTWALASASLGAAAQVVLGDWTTDQRGACRVPVGRVWPGAEQMGLLALDPGVVYGDDGPYRVVAHALAARPPLFTGTAMDTGLVFGLRGPDDFYLLRASILHDTVSLDRFLHGRKRNLREEHLLMHGDEWHELQLDVADHAVAATVDGHRLFDTTGLDDIDGGLGLWARVTAAGCFADVTVEPLPSA